MNWVGRKCPLAHAFSRYVGFPPQYTSEGGAEHDKYSLASRRGRDNTVLNMPQVPYTLPNVVYVRTACHIHTKSHAVHVAGLWCILP